MKPYIQKFEGARSFVKTASPLRLLTKGIRPLKSAYKFLAGIPANKPFFVKGGNPIIRSARNAYRAISPIIAPNILPRSLNPKLRTMYDGARLMSLGVTGQELYNHGKDYYNNIKQSLTNDLSDFFGTSTTALLTAKNADNPIPEEYVRQALASLPANADYVSTRDSIVQSLRSVPKSQIARLSSKYGLQSTPLLAESYVNLPWSGWRAAKAIANPASEYIPYAISKIPHASPKSLLNKVTKQISPSTDPKNTEKFIDIGYSLAKARAAAKNGNQVSVVQNTQDALGKAGLPKDIDHLYPIIEDYVKNNF